jgi:rhamnogalacturonyl hydrolase YesR
MKRYTIICLVLSFWALKTMAQSDVATLSMRDLIQENFQFAAKQYKILQKNTPITEMPRSFVAATNSLVTSDTKWWCSGFYPGSLWMIYEQTKDAAIRKEAEYRLSILEKEQYYTGNHDLGFMMFCSFGNAYRITSNKSYPAVIKTAAASLITRYRPSIKSIQSWDSSRNFKCPVIIDNMMNLELLLWATEHGGDARFKEIAIAHAQTTLKNQFRVDNSSYHVIDYDLKSGTVARKTTAQGAADSSAWSRGQAWGLYGFTVMYRFTKDKVYLEQAKKIAGFILKHPNLPKDKIPFWDFNAPGLPNTYRDASAASILASALLELAQYGTKEENANYIANAETIIRVLSSPAYRSQLGENAGFLLNHSVGALPYHSEVDVPLTYADYYFLESMMRYKNWYLGKK